MANEGINWGKVVLGAVGVTAAALVAPSLLNGIADVTLGEGVSAAASGAPFLDQVGEGARALAGSLNSTYAGVATSIGVNGANFSSVGGVFDALGTAGDKAISWTTNNPTTAAMAVGGGALGGAAIGQWTSKAAGAGSKPTGPGGMSYADYIRARQRLASMTPPNRTA